MPPKFPKPWVYLVFLAAVCAVVALSFVDGALACYTLAALLALYAALRAVLPDGAVPRVRSKTHDVVILLIWVLLLVILGSWANTPAIS